MIHQLTQVMVRSGATWVLWLLLAMSVCSIAIAIERALVFRRLRCDVPRLVPELRRLLRARDFARANQLLSDSPSVEAKVVRAGLAEAQLGADASGRAMGAAMGIERARLEQRLLFLGTVGNNAPFVGLLGTVIGVVGAFDALGRPQAFSGAAAGALAPERVMGTIAEALVATAVGLIVAIPAVAAYNYFQGRIGTALTGAETLGNVLLAHLEGERNTAIRSHERRDFAAAE